MSVWRFANLISAIPRAAQLTLGEGDTPLVRTRRIGPTLGVPNLYFKLEMSNPSGSYKDRYAAVAIADIVARRKTRCLATSSGNTGAALAAYCAATGIDCAIAIIENTPIGKLSQMLAYGARLFTIRGFGPDPDITAGVFHLLQQLAGAMGDTPKISAFCHNPVGMSGVQTISYELAEQAQVREFTIDHLFTPAGGGGLTLAVALGFEQLTKVGQIPHTPSVECVQPEGNDTIASPLRVGDEHARAVRCTTKISGLQVPSVLDGDDVITHCRASGGTGHTVTDEQVWDTQQRLAREEGIFCEPAGAVALAGALGAVTSGVVDAQANIVCLMTGSGFKDPSSIEKMNQTTSIPKISLDQLETHIGNSN